MGDGVGGKRRGRDGGRWTRGEEFSQEEGKEGGACEMTHEGKVRSDTVPRVGRRENGGRKGRREGA